MATGTTLEGFLSEAVVVPTTTREDDYGRKRVFQVIRIENWVVALISGVTWVWMDWGGDSWFCGENWVFGC